MNKNNSRNNRNIKRYIPLQFSCNLTGMKPAIGYYSYTRRQPSLNETLSNDKILSKNTLQPYGEKSNRKVSEICHW